MSQHYTPEHFKFNCMIGEGTYAKVFLATRIQDNELFALKVLKKRYIIEKNQQMHIMTEKSILSQINHPFLIKMVSCFQDAKKLYFVLEYCPGGELFQLLSSKDKIAEEQAAFFAVQIASALDELHKHKIIYRDLKPENIIIDQKGYIKLTDFGLSKILKSEQDLAKTICGTPEYLAPEIVNKSGHGIQVDWWCLGCLIHEMVTGFPPFKTDDDNRMKMFEDIVFKQPKLKQCSPKLQDLLKRLLNKNPKQRLGSKGSKQVLQHPWFSNLNINGILQKKQQAPFVPKLTNKTDTRNFNGEFTSVKVSSYEESPNEKSVEDKFKDF